MNRIVIIGNGFDLAHGLPTSYKDFIKWYWSSWIERLSKHDGQCQNDEFCTFKIIPGVTTWKEYITYKQAETPNLDPLNILRDIFTQPSLFDVTISPFMHRISSFLEIQNWVDIESIYYSILKEEAITPEKTGIPIESLNSELEIIKFKLIEYLSSLKVTDSPDFDAINKIIYGPVDGNDIAVSDRQAFIEFALSWVSLQPRHAMGLYHFAGFDGTFVKSDLMSFQAEQGKTTESGCEFDLFDWEIVSRNSFPKDLLLPNDVLLLDFNYTKTTERYLHEGYGKIIHIHGSLDSPDSILFGYGDELDDEYKKLLKIENNEVLKNFKSIKYLEADNYRRLLDFIDADKYQIYILGHSCGISDRTLLNTLFEHPNCVSIKPYFHQIDKQKDNYLSIVQNIYRNFTDMKLMRERVVNKTLCSPLPQSPKPKPKLKPKPKDA